LAQAPSHRACLRVSNPAPPTRALPKPRCMAQRGMNVAVLVLCLLSVAMVGVAGTRLAKERPVMKVVRLLQDMQAELEKESADDKQVYESLGCWCKENDAEKTKAIDVGEAKMADLNAALGEYAAKIEELREGLATTRAKLKQDQEALNSATAIRTQEASAFHGEEKELLDAVQACKQALVVLSKHHPSLSQLRSVAKTLEALKVMQQARDSLGKDKVAVLKAFLQQASDEGTGSLRRIPGFQSYTPQSGQIFGILQQMQEDFEADLSTAQKQEQKAREDYEALKAAKEAELAAGEKQLTQLKQDDAEFREKNVQAYEELNDTREQLEIDKEFLAKLRKRCEETDREYEARTKSRLEEIAAVGETIAYLNSDEAFGVFDKTVNTAFLLQTSALRRSPQRSVAEMAARHRAAQVLSRAGVPKLALLAESAQLDTFAKVQEAIQKMVAELNKQQQEEVEHRDWCIEEISKNKRTTADRDHKKTDLETQIDDTKKALAEFTKEIEAKQASIAEMEVEMKKASEIREAQHADFQQTVADHRITQAILRKASDRMAQVYGFIQEPEQAGAPHVQLSGNATDPGNGPARFTEYSKHAGGSKVLALLETVIADSKKLENEALAGEQDSQSSYENFMKDSNASIKQNQRAVVDLSAAKAKAEQTLSLAGADLKATLQELESLQGVLAGLDKSCDFLLNNFETRQEARLTEVSALKEASAILAGMK